MLLRRLTIADLEAVRVLRNANRHTFFHSDEISASQQRDWFDRVSSRPVVFYVIELDAAVAGTISLTTAGAEIEVGNLVLATTARGRGLMRAAVTQLTTAPGRYFAEVKAENQASLSVFRATGFSESVSREIVRFTKIVPA